MRKTYYLFPRPRQNGKPIWYVQVYKPDGTLGTPRSSGQTNKTLAERWADEKTQAGDLSEILVRDFVQPFYAEDCEYCRKQKHTKGMTEKTRKQKRKYIEDYILRCDWLMGKKLSRVTRHDLERYRDDYLIGERYDDEPCRTSQAVMEVVKTIFGQAVEQGCVLQNPVYRLPTGKYDAVQREALSEKEFDALLKKSNFATERYYLATMIAALLGMRAGEVRGLQFGDLDARAGIVRVDRALKNESDVVGPPKWGRRRIAPYPKKLQALLKPLKGSADVYLFAWGEEASLNYSRWRVAFADACAKAKVETTLHGLRHTLNTLLLLRGIPDAVIRAALGWSDPKIQARYTHVTFGRDSYRSPLVDSVVEAIQGKPGTP